MGAVRMKIELAHGRAYLTRTPCGWYLESIVVDEGYRNKGIGTKLMKKVTQKCDSPIYLLATSELGGDYQRLIRFYEKFGFEKRKQPRNDGVGFNYNMVR